MATLQAMQTLTTVEFESLKARIHLRDWHRLRSDGLMNPDLPPLHLLRRAGSAVSGRPRVTGRGIAADIQRARSTALVGREAATADDLAELAQVYRDPRDETFRVFYTKGDTIVHSTGVSARLPGKTPMVPAGMTEAQYVRQFQSRCRSANGRRSSRSKT